MNSEKMNQLCIMGAYVKGAFDAAASRGTLSQQGIQTLINALVGLYGSEEFVVQSSDPSAIPFGSGPGDVSEISAAVKKAAEFNAHAAEKSQDLADKVKKKVGVQ